MCRLICGRSIQRAILQSFSQMFSLNQRAGCKIGNRAGNTQYAVMRTCGQAEPVEGSSKHGRCLLGQRTVGGKLRGREQGVAQVGTLPLVLYITRGKYTGAYLGRAFLFGFAASRQRCVFDRLYGYLQVDPVEQRAGQTLEILLHRCFGAGAASGAVPAAFAGVHRGDQLKTGRVCHLSCNAGYCDLTIFQRLPQGFENIPVEFGQLIQKQNTAVGKRDLAGKR